MLENSNKLWYKSNSNKKTSCVLVIGMYVIENIGFLVLSIRLISER